jgi:hypothetical protein
LSRSVSASSSSRRWRVRRRTTAWYSFIDGGRGGRGRAGSGHARRGAAPEQAPAGRC